MKLILSVLAVALVFSAVSYGVREYDLSSDQRLEEAREKFDKGLMLKARGDREFRNRPGVAQKWYENSEDYFSQAVFFYTELGKKHGIDTGKEVSLSERLLREVHVLVGKARGQSRRRGVAF